jgi:hypothetical protein
MSALLLVLLLLPQSWNPAMKMAGYIYALNYTGTF